MLLWRNEQQLTATRVTESEGVMKIGWKLLVLWMASMTLFFGTAVATWMTMDVMEGISGLTIRFFLGYCGIIVVFQVLSALDAIRQLFNDIPEKHRHSIRNLLR
jgi:hypothetical protein